MLVLCWVCVCECCVCVCFNGPFSTLRLPTELRWLTGLHKHPLSSPSKYGWIGQANPLPVDNITNHNKQDKSIPFSHCILRPAKSDSYVDLMLISHYCDVIMGAMASPITSLTIVYSTIYSGADQRKHQSSASLAFVRRIHRSPVNSPHKWPIPRNKFPFKDGIMHFHVSSYILQNQTRKST